MIWKMKKKKKSLRTRAIILFILQTGSGEGGTKAFRYKRELGALKIPYADAGRGLQITKSIGPLGKQ